MKHFVVIGGSGMLLDFVKQKLDDGHKVALLCRNPPQLKGYYYPLSCNYNAPEKFPKILDEHFKQNGKSDDVICWMRSGSVYSFLAMCELISSSYPNTRLWHLRGSSWYQDPKALPFHIPEELLTKLNYHKIYLGSIETESKQRWLTDEEICTGVEKAVDAKKEMFCVGNFPPFDSLP